METRTTYTHDPINEAVIAGTFDRGRPLCILGIDCGFGAPGMAVVMAEPVLINGSQFHTNPRKLEFIFGECIKTERLQDRQSVAYDDCRRISAIGKWLRDHHDRFQPDIVVMEIPFSGARGAMAIKGMAYATGISVSVAESYFKCKILQLCSPYETKKWCTGNTKAEKMEVINAVSKHFPDVSWPRLKKKDALDLDRCEAIADSLAAILTFLRVPTAPGLNKLRVSV